MVVPGIALFIMAFVYYFYTQDTPEGNFSDLKKNNPEFRAKTKESGGAFLAAVKDYRVWGLFLIYGACFGVELTINNIAALYYKDYFTLDVKTAGLIAGLFGLMNIFARSLGGFVGDKAGIRWGLKGRVYFLFVVLFLEGLSLMLFSRISVLPLAIGSMVIFSLFVQMAEGATFSVVPFVNKKAVGTVSGIVGAGGNAGAVAAGFLFKAEGISYQQGLLILGAAVTVISLVTFLVRFSKDAEEVEKAELKDCLKIKEESLDEVEPAFAYSKLNK
jgi:NNP family nitrate/nitrite transporter-like MFS transporter